MQGHIRKRLHRGKDGRTSTTWYVVVDSGRSKAGKRQQKWHGGFQTRKEAEAAKAKIVTNINSGTYTAPSRLTLEGYLRDEWLQVMRSRLKETTFDSYSRCLELHVIPTLGPLHLQQVTTSKLNALYAELLRSGRRNGSGTGLSARSVAYIHRIVHSAFADAVRSQLIAQNPATNAQPPRARVDATVLHSWTPQELNLFLRSTEDSEMHAVWHVAAMTGLRRGELLALQWQDVELERCQLIVQRSATSIAYKVVYSTPKSHRSRIVDLDSATVELLRALKPKLAKADDYVFTTPDGGAIHPDRLSKVFNRDVKAAGLPRIRLHDLRHTHATIALQAGVSVKVVSERLCHESPAFTLTQYAHVLPGMQAQAAAAVARAVQVDRSDVSNCP